jgi:hypothetical protein
VHAGDDDTVARGWLMRAKANIIADRFEAAAADAEAVSWLRVSTTVAAERDDVLGLIDRRLERDASSAEHFASAAASYGASYQRPKQAMALFNLGIAHETGSAPAPAAALVAYEAAESIIGDLREGMFADTSRVEFRQQFDDLYDRLVDLTADPDQPTFDPRQAWVNMERAKARSLAEMVGLARLPVADPPAAAVALLEEERVLIERLRAARLTQLGASATSDLAQSDVAARAQTRLEALWTALAESLPDYVALRRGTIPSWRAFQALLQ